MRNQLLIAAVIYMLLFSVFIETPLFGFINTDSLKLQKKFLKKSEFVFIPQGSYSATHNSDVSFEENGEKVAINSFFMLQREVTNADYLEFLAAMNGSDNDNWHSMLPDTTCWRTKNSYSEPMVNLYFRHPAYRNYPLVGVSYAQAQRYCQWLTEKYNADPDRLYEEVEFRLPTAADWEWAARGGLQNTPFPWPGNTIMNNKGYSRANCIQFESASVYRDTVYQKTKDGSFEQKIIYRANPGWDNMAVAGSLSDGACYTAPVNSYWENGYGLYNMAGNVAEMVQEEGVTCGGSWRDPGYYLQNHVRQYYEGENSASSKRGFRVIMVVKEMERR